MRELGREASAYPDRVRLALPALERIWVRGAWPWADGPSVAIVGARAATGHGLARARLLAAELSAAGVRVVSGGAVGIDAAAHRGALDAAATPTAAVLAPGLDAPYPAHHRPLYEAIVAAGGTLVSAVPPGTAVQRWQFPARNEVMAALVDAVVIVECRPGSGTMTTARAAARLGRLVAAMPGSTGGEALLARGAATVERGNDLIEALAGRPRHAQIALPDAASDEGRAFAALDAAEARAPEAIGALAGLPALVAARALLALELDGLALPAPGGRYLRAAHAA